MQEINIKPNVLIGTWAWGSGYNGASMVFGKKVDEEYILSDDHSPLYAKPAAKAVRAAAEGEALCFRQRISSQISAAQTSAVGRSAKKYFVVATLCPKGAQRMACVSRRITSSAAQSPVPVECRSRPQR